MNTGELIILLVAWNVIGGMCSLVPADKCSLFGTFSYLNPIFLYDYHSNLNWFGVILLTLFYNLLCPVATIIYWFYKLCTVGRK